MDDVSRTFDVESVDCLGLAHQLLVQDSAHPLKHLRRKKRRKTFRKGAPKFANVYYEVSAIVN